MPRAKGAARWPGARMSRGVASRTPGLDRSLAAHDIPRPPDPDCAGAGGGVEKGQRACLEPAHNASANGTTRWSFAWLNDGRGPNAQVRTRILRIARSFTGQ